MYKNKKTYLTIGELVSKFKKYYPDVSSSKLRFLESKGLIAPSRAENRYRIYFKDDVRKLNVILKMQKEFFLPLEVIKEKLETINFEEVGKNKKENEGLLKLQDSLHEKESQISAGKMQVSDVLTKYKISKNFIDDLAEEELISYKEIDNVLYIEGADLEIVRIAGELSAYGLFPKHLKIFENSAIRQASFLQQIIYPLVMTKRKDSYKKASKLLYRLESIFLEFHEKLFKKANKNFLEDYK